jgi:hypothetical protein
MYDMFANLGSSESENPQSKFPILPEKRIGSDGGGADISAVFQLSHQKRK